MTWESTDIIEREVRLLQFILAYNFDILNVGNKLTLVHTVRGEVIVGTTYISLLRKVLLVKNTYTFKSEFLTFRLDPINTPGTETGKLVRETWSFEMKDSTYLELIATDYMTLGTMNIVI